MSYRVSEKKERVFKTLTNIEMQLDALPKLEISTLNKEKLIIVYVDVINGFVCEGALSSTRAQRILPHIEVLDQSTKGCQKIAFIDAHPKDAVEFDTYPVHCVEDTSETHLSVTLDAAVQKIYKNGINGFHASKFQDWLKGNPEADTFIVAGLVTDICVMNFALTLKAYFNEQNKPSRIIIPVEAVETFDLEATDHDAELMNLFALYNMRMNGIELYNLGE